MHSSEHDRHADTFSIIHIRELLLFIYSLFITHRSISPGTNPQMALVTSNPLRFSKELTFKWHVSNFHVNRAINSKATVVKVKVFSKWVPRLLTMEQKQQRVDDSESCLSLFTKHGSIISLRSRSGSQLSGVQPVKAVRSVRKRNSQLAKSWRQFFGMRTV